MAALRELDHMIVAVPDLDAAATRLGEALGLVIQPGGAHPGWGTHNAIARFGVSYLELIAVHDRDLAARRPRGERLLASLDRGPGWLGYAVGTDDLDAALEALRARGLAAGPPDPGERTRPDGLRLRWHTLSLDDGMWGGVLPFLIQHETPAGVRRGWAPPGGHPSGVTGVKALGVAVPELETAIPAYRALFGREPRRDRFAFVGARRANWKLPDGCVVRLMAPDPPGTGPLAEHLAARGPSLFVVAFAVPDVQATIAELRRRGTAISDPQPGRAAFTLDPAQTLDTRFAFVQAELSVDAAGGAA